MRSTPGLGDARCVTKSSALGNAATVAPGFSEEFERFTCENLCDFRRSAGRN